MLLFTHLHVIPIQYAVIYPMEHKIEFLNILHSIYSELVQSRSKNVKKNNANVLYISHLKPYDCFVWCTELYLSLNCRLDAITSNVIGSQVSHNQMSSCQTFTIGVIFNLRAAEKVKTLVKNVIHFVLFILYTVYK